MLRSQINLYIGVPIIMLPMAVCRLSIRQKEGCYVTPKVTSSNQGLSHLVDTLNKYTGVTITYKIGDKQETLPE